MPKDFPTAKFSSLQMDSEHVKALELIREKASRILKDKIHHHYTDHSINHSDRIVTTLFQIFEENPKFGMNSEEKLVLFSAAYLHDIGMQSPKLDMIGKIRVPINKLSDIQREMIRDRHAEISAHMIQADVKGYRDYPDLGLKDHNDTKDLAFQIADVCSQHNIENPELEKEFKYASKTIRIGLLIALLRLGDVLDMSRKRVDTEQLKRFDIPLESKFRWLKCQYVDSVNLENGCINVYLRFPSSFSEPYVIFFADEIMKKIKAEWHLCGKKLVTSGLPLWLNENHIRQKYDYGSTIQIMDNEMEEYVNKLIQRTRSELLSSDMRFEDTRTISKDDFKKDWISYWNFIGNPWADYPISCNDEKFVMTTNIERTISEIGNILKGSSGEIKLLVGKRGQGKTTFFYSLEEKFTEREGYALKRIEIGETIQTIRDAKEIYNRLMKKIYEVVKGKKLDDEFQVSILKNAVSEYHHRKLIICIDNFDTWCCNIRSEKVGIGPSSEILMSWRPISRC